ncbi:MAG TPA: DsbC family protein [Gammaproteobacteria bacterium]|jgi:thiol:disulfide interchange protein DsbC
MNKTVILSAAAGILLLIGASLQAQEPAADDQLTRLLKLRLGSEQIAPPVETEIDGVYMTRFGNRFAYLLEGGRYIFVGDLVDLEQGRNLTELSRREMVVDELAAFGSEKRVIFPAVDEEKAVLSVFTDTSCGYCQQLHREVEYLQQAGISVHYIPFPRGGNRGPGYQDLKQVWCSQDPLEAMSIAKKARPGDLDAAENCESAQYVDEGYQLGNRIGVSGTPSLYTADGTHFNGYVPYRELIQRLLMSP